jgi:hypothetical protein
LFSIHSHSSDNAEKSPVFSDPAKSLAAQAAPFKAEAVKAADDSPFSFYPDLKHRNILRNKKSAKRR